MQVNIVQVLMNHSKRVRSRMFTVKQVAHVVKFREHLPSHEMERLQHEEMELAAQLAHAQDMYERGLQP